MNPQWLRWIAGLALMLALVVMARAAYGRWLGVSPTFAPCVAALEEVTVGQGLAQARPYLLDAVAAGAQMWPEGPGLLADDGAGASTGSRSWSESFICPRYLPDDREGLLPSLRMWT